MRLVRVVGHMLIAAVVAVVVTAVSLTAISRVQWPAYNTSNQLHALTTAGQFTCLAGLLVAGWLWRRGRAKLGWTAAVVFLAAFSVVTLGMPLGATKLYLFGISVDQQFRTEYLTRLTDTAALHDMTYVGLPPYYPPGWFWIGGRAAALTGTPAWEMFKPWAVTSITVAVVVAFVLWTKLIRFELALIVTAATAAATLAYSPAEPYAAIITVLLPPMLVLAWSGLRGGSRGGGWGAVVAVGIFLGCAALFYNLLFAYTAFTIVIMAAVAVAARWRADRRFDPLLRLAVIAAIAVAIALIGWLPYLLAAIADSPAGLGAAQHYLPLDGSQLSFPMLQFTLLGGLCMVGTLWLAVRARSSTRAGALAIGVVAVYAWSLLSMLTTLLRTTLLSFRLQPTLTVLLAAAGAFGFVEATQAIARRYSPAACTADRRLRRGARRARRARLQPGHPQRAEARSRCRLYRHRRQRAAGRPPTAGRSNVLRRDRREDPPGHRQAARPGGGADRRLQLPVVLSVLGIPGIDVALREPVGAIRQTGRGHRKLGGAEEPGPVHRGARCAALETAHRLPDAPRRERHLHAAPCLRRLPEPAQCEALPGRIRGGAVLRSAVLRHRDRAVRAGHQACALTSTSVAGVAGGGAGNYRTARIVAMVTGLLGVALALATPLLPVKQTTAQLNWPQNGVFSSVTAPLISYVATDLNITVPCRAAAGLAGPENANKTVLLSTVPKQAPKAIDRGLLIQRVNDKLLLIVRNTPVVTAPLSQVLSPACQRLTFTAHADKVTAEFVGLVKGPDGDDPGAPLRGQRSGYDFRPQIVGVFTDLSGPAPPGLSFSATVDTRYSSAPTPIKMLAMILGVAMTVVSLIALHVLDGADGMRHRRFLPSRWWSATPLDGVVAAVLVWWHFVGANTADDGYILTMARVSENAGYMANYYRWFGTPEAPFGWYYDLLAMWTHVSTASVWVRLPTLVMALTCWWLISREVIPRLGHAVKTHRAAAWTAAGMFLAFWLPLNNGLRPEPIIALGILVTWCSVERAVATSRLLPLAIACVIGALTLFSGPTGIASIGALLVAIGPLRTILHRRSARFGYLALLAPIAAACTVTLILIFRDQTLVGEVEANTLKSAVGPSLSWFDEHIRYERLFMATPDGSIARRFAVLALLVALAVVIAMALRKGRIPGTAAGPSRRIIGITIISFIAMMFTPTKWTHHFGVFAGLAGSLGALAAVAVTATVMRSRRNRAVFAALVLFITALSFASVNGYWYVSNFGVPWANELPAFEFGFTTMLLGLTILVLLVAAWFHFSEARHRAAGRRR